MLAVRLVVVTAILAAVEGQSAIEDDLLNGVKRSTTHDYEVHDHDAEHENKSDDDSRFSSVAQGIQEHRVPPTRPREPISVEVNGNSGYVDHFVDIANPFSTTTEEILDHSNDNVHPFVPPEANTDINFSDLERKVKVGVLENTDRKNIKEENAKVSSAEHISQEEPLEDRLLDNVQPLKNSDSNEELQVDPLESTDHQVDKKDAFPVNKDEHLSSSNGSSGSKHFDLEFPKTGNSPSISDTFFPQIHVQVIYDGENSGAFVQNMPINEYHETLNRHEADNTQPMNMKDEVNVTGLMGTTLQNATPHHHVDQAPLPSSGPGTSTPIIRVHVPEDASTKTVNTDGVNLSTQGKSSTKVKTRKYSPITRISALSSAFDPPIIINGPRVQPIRRVLIGIKKNILPKQDLDDSLVSSSTTLSTETVDDGVDGQYDDEDYSEEEKADEDQDSQQELRIKKNPIEVHPGENPSLFSTPSLIGGIPLLPIPPLHIPGPPTKIHQPVLHHIVHSFHNPPNPEEELADDLYLKRYSADFVPFPPYLAVPY